MRQQMLTSNGLTWTSQNQNKKRTQRRRDAKNSQSFSLRYLCVFASLRESFCFFCKKSACNYIAWLGVVMLLVATPSQAGEAVPYTLAQRTQKAEVIVVAEVESISSNWDNEGREIFTYIILRVTERIKGDIAGNQIVLRHLGGAVGNVESRVSGMPQFIRNEKVLVFLGRYPSSPYFGVMDWLEGKKTIQYNAAGQEMVKAGISGESIRLLKEYIGEIQSLLKQK